MCVVSIVLDARYIIGVILKLVDSGWKGLRNDLWMLVSLISRDRLFCLKDQADDSTYVCSHVLYIVDYLVGSGVFKRVDHDPIGVWFHV